MVFLICLLWGCCHITLPIWTGFQAQFRWVYRLSEHRWQVMIKEGGGWKTMCDSKFPARTPGRVRSGFHLILTTSSAPISGSLTPLIVITWIIICWDRLRKIPISPPVIPWTSWSTGLLRRLRLSLGTLWRPHVSDPGVWSSPVDAGMASFSELCIDYYNLHASFLFFQ